MSYSGTFFAVDVEAGGIPDELKKKAFLEVALTEIAFVAIDNQSLQIKDKKSWLVKPYSEKLIFTPRAAEISGINKQMCEEHGQDIKVVFKEILDFIKKNKFKSQKSYLVGQNIIDYDFDFISEFFSFMGKPISEFFSNKIKDTMVYSREKWPEERIHKLSAICQRFDIPYVESHRASADTEMTAKVFIQFMKLIRGENVVESSSKNEFNIQIPNFEF